MELLILVLLAILIVEEIRAFLSRKRFAAMMAEQALLAQELQAVESQLANEWVCRAMYELECQ